MKRFWLPLGILGMWLLLFVDVSIALASAGLLCAGAGAWLLRRIFSDTKWTAAATPDDPGALPAVAPPARRLRGHAARLAFLVLFIPVFLGKVVASGWSIAKLALMPSMDFWPGIVKIKGDLPTLNHTTLLAYLITLTPGTFTLDYDEQGDNLYVHWIDVTGYGEDDMDERAISGLRRWAGRLMG